MGVQKYRLTLSIPKKSPTILLLLRVKIMKQSAADEQFAALPIFKVGLQQ
jgi:hypothetical protein